MSAYSELQLSSFVDQIFERLRAIEAQLAVLSEKAGVPYEAASQEAPAEVVALVEAGDRMGALRKYRELTGADMDVAQEAIAKL
jgi:ribosomal protein L7/L12